MRIIFTFLTAMLLVMSLFLMENTATAAPAKDALRVELKSLAADIAKIVEKNGGGKVAVGEFSSSSKIVGSAGPGVQLILADELRAAGLTIDSKDYRFEVSGRYQLIKTEVSNTNSTTELNAVKMVALLSDAETGEFLAERPTGRLIFGAETVSVLLGLNVSGEPSSDPKKVSDQIDKAIAKPQVEISDTKIFGNTKKFALEVIVKTKDGYQPTSVVFTDSEPFTNLKTDSVYGVRVYNNADFEAAVDLRIDGISCLAFSETKSRYFIVKPGGHIDILGWPIREGLSKEFKVVADYPETAVASLNLKPSPGVGMISVTYSAAWEPSGKPPGDEATRGIGTGFGEDIANQNKQAFRTIGRVRDVLSVRYAR